MYASHWGLRESPFGSRVAPQFFYQGPAHEEALARLYFLVEQHRRLGLLMGPPGSGKSLLLDLFAEQLRRSGRAVARLSLLGVQPAEMFHLLAAELCVGLDAGATLAEMWRAVTDRLLEYRYQQIETVLLCDDADQAGRQVLSQVTRLAQHDLTPASRLTIVLAGREDRMGRLGDRLLELADLRIDLLPWQEHDTAEFVSRALTQAGRESPVFADAALARLHELAHGVPRRVAQLADLALLAGAGRELQQIDGDVLDSVFQELGVVDAQAELAAP